MPDMQKGDIIRRNGGDWSLWRVDETYDADSPYVFAVLVSNHKFHKAGMEKKVARKSDFQVEPDPATFAKSHLFTIDLDITLNPKASWK